MATCFQCQKAPATVCLDCAIRQQAQYVGLGEHLGRNYGFWLGAWCGAFAAAGLGLAALVLTRWLS